MSNAPAWCLVLGLLLLPSSCASYQIESLDLTLEPGGWVHAHGKALEVMARSTGPGMLKISMLDAQGNLLEGSSLGVGRWSADDKRATDVWLKNESEKDVHLDVWATGVGTVAVTTLRRPK